MEGQLKTTLMSGIMVVITNALSVCIIPVIQMRKQINIMKTS